MNKSIFEDVGDLGRALMFIIGILLFGGGLIGALSAVANIASDIQVIVALVFIVIAIQGIIIARIFSIKGQ